MRNEMCQYLDNWQNYTASREHQEHEKEWSAHKKSLCARQRFNYKAITIINFLMTVASVVLTFYIVTLLVLYFLDGKGI